jgi:hypothetical protein
MQLLQNLFCFPGEVVNTLFKSRSIHHTWAKCAVKVLVQKSLNGLFQIDLQVNMPPKRAVFHSGHWRSIQRSSLFCTFFSWLRTLNWRLPSTNCIVAFITNNLILLVMHKKMSLKLDIIYYFELNKQTSEGFLFNSYLMTELCGFETVYVHLGFIIIFWRISHQSWNDPGGIFGKININFARVGCSGKVLRWHSDARKIYFGQSLTERKCICQALRYKQSFSFWS